MSYDYLNEENIDMWKPFDFLTYADFYMQTSGVDYVATDLKGDLRSIRACLNMIAARKKGPTQMTAYIRWCVSGLDKSVPVTGLGFLIANARHYFGDNPRKVTLRKQNTETVLSAGMKHWIAEQRKEQRRNRGT